jgi:hypothetical protein
VRQALKTRDDWLTEAIGRTTSRLSRRSVLAKGGGFIATAFATAVLGPLNGKDEAFAAISTCHPPCGEYCSGCTRAGGCPSCMVNCTSSDPFGRGTRCCPHASGWWYTRSAKGTRVLCRDCRVMYGPCSCTKEWCEGFCGCRSTIRY